MPRTDSRHPLLRALTLVAGAALACSAPDPSLGPVDGHDLPATDLERVSVGDLAPDFSLESYDGRIVTLSSFRGRQNVLLVFYRGHW